jgi:hypothetical protein
MGVTLAVCWALAYIVFKGFGVNIYYFMHSVKMHKKISILGEPRFPYDPSFKENLRISFNLSLLGEPWFPKGVA